MNQMNLPRVRIACAVVAMCAGVFVWSWSPPAGASSSGYTWPQFHGDPGLSGTSADPSISSSNASTLGVKWMAQVGATEGSPVEAWNASLGEPLAYVGDENGYMNAVNARTGAIVWSAPFGSAFTATPLVSGSSVWVAPLASGRIYKLDAATGAIQCAVKEVGSIQGTPVVATLPGGQTLVYFPTLDTGGADGSIYAINTYSCATVFAWNGSGAFSTHAGVWTPISYGVDADGVPLVLFGSADPDSSEYAINAATGSLVWRYYTNNPPGEDWDIGAGSTISAPGVNGFPDGVGVLRREGWCLLCAGLDHRGIDLVLGLRPRDQHRRSFDAGPGRLHARLWRQCGHLCPRRRQRESPLAVQHGGRHCELVVRHRRTSGSAGGRLRHARRSGPRRVTGHRRALYSYQTGSFISASPPISTERCSSTPPMASSTTSGSAVETGQRRPPR